MTKRPSDVGLTGNLWTSNLWTSNLWTGKLMYHYLKNTYGIIYKSGIYDLLERLNLSHQKAHTDYSNAKPSEQRAFIDQLKTTLLEADQKTAIVTFDEFSVCNFPCVKNQVLTMDGQKKIRAQRWSLMKKTRTGQWTAKYGLLSIDLFSADCLFAANKEAKSEQIAYYFADLATVYESNGFEKLVIFLDRNPTHKTKMQSIFADLTQNLTIQTEFALLAC